MHTNILIFMASMVATHMLAQPMPISYTYPLHKGTHYTQREPIIVHTHAIINTSIYNALQKTQIIGSKSGTHPFSLTLGSDKKTATFTIKDTFQTSEQITVVLNNAIANTPPWQFSISNVSDQAQAHKRQKYATYSEPIHPPDLITTTGNIVYDSIAPTAEGYIVAPGLLPGVNLLYNNGSIFRHTDLDPSPVIIKPLRDTLLAAYNQTGFIVFNHLLQQKYFVSPPDALTTLDFHDFELSPNGNPLFVTSSVRSIDISTWFPGVGEKDVMDYVITELDNQTGIPVWRWRCLDHLTVLEGVNTGAGAIDIQNNLLDFFHWNSLSLTPDNQYLISMRNCNAAYKINRTTGNILWKLGGNNSTFKFLNDDDNNGFILQHHITLSDSNTINIFDNGIFHSPPRSRAVQYRLNEADSTATLEWAIPSPNNGLSQIMGSVQTFDNGNKLICWGRVPSNSSNATHYITEYDTYGNLVYDIRGNTGKIIYRAYRMNIPPEVISALSHTQLGSHIAVLTQPNPANQQLRLTIHTPTLPQQIHLIVSDATGRTMLTKIENPTANSTHLTLDTHSWTAGIYYYTITTDKNPPQSGTLHIMH